MEKYKITKTEIDENNVKSAPDMLKGSPKEAKNVFDKLPELIAAKFNDFIDALISRYYTKAEVEAVIGSKIVKLGAGDMAQAVYDADDDGVVDKAKEAETAEKAVNAENAVNAETAQTVRGFWINKTDADGNLTDKLFLHYYEYEETEEVLADATAI